MFSHTSRGDGGELVTRGVVPTAAPCTPHPLSIARDLARVEQRVPLAGAEDADVFVGQPLERLSRRGGGGLSPARAHAAVTFCVVVAVTRGGNPPDVCSTAAVRSLRAPRERTDRQTSCDGGFPQPRSVTADGQTSRGDLPLSSGRRTFLSGCIRHCLTQVVGSSACGRRDGTTSSHHRLPTGTMAPPTAGRACKNSTRVSHWPCRGA